MPMYTPDSMVHRLVEHTCAFPECTNSKLQGAAMRLCAQCKTLYYCGRDCQRADWTRHKAWCKAPAERLERQAEINGGLAEGFDAWRVAVGPMPFTWICVQGLAVFNHPDNFRTKFVVLSLRKRIESASTPRKIFEYVRIETFDRSALRLALGGDTASTQELVDQVRESDDLAKSLEWLSSLSTYFHPRMNISPSHAPCLWSYGWTSSVKARRPVGKML
ncbi:hypothetical protein C8R45DRAFT_532350 [Mycena sanguinolenta]|nr:hypothetical protein C8R45DRAFT_532350 [Mycena sanguinolenta]